MKLLYELVNVAGSEVSIVVMKSCLAKSRLKSSTLFSTEPLWDDIRFILMPFIGEPPEKQKKNDLDTRGHDLKFAGK